MSMRGPVPRYGARKKKGYIGRKQEYIFESGAWTYSSCNWQSTNFVFRQTRPEYIPGGSNGSIRDQLKALQVFILFLVLVSRKRAAEPHPWSGTK